MPGIGQNLRRWNKKQKKHQKQHKLGGKLESKEGRGMSNRYDICQYYHKQGTRFTVFHENGGVSFEEEICEKVGQKEQINNIFLLFKCEL